MSNSRLVTYTNLSNHYSVRTHAIDTITIHCYVGQVTAKQGCDYFASTDREASCNYVVGKDGSIGLCVEEKNRSWCSSNRDNDNRSVTIEVASDTTHPYRVTDEALSALIQLVFDICERNGIPELRWRGDKSLIGQVDQQNMTVHRWFANKACPGDYLYNLHGYIAEQVNKELEGNDMITQEQFNKMMDNYLAERAKQDGGDWSKEARDWAVSEGIIGGTSSDSFTPEWKSWPTREQLVVILKRMLEG